MNPNEPIPSNGFSHLNPGGYSIQPGGFSGGYSIRPGGLPYPSPGGFLPGGHLGGFSNPERFIPLNPEEFNERRGQTGVSGWLNWLIGRGESQPDESNESTGSGGSNSDSEESGESSGQIEQFSWQFGGSNLSNGQISRYTGESSVHQTAEIGSVSRIQDYKYAAALLYRKRDESGLFFCSATIITNTKVLAAAHCVRNRTSIVLELGTIDTDDKYYTVNVSQQEIFIHPEFSNGSAPYLNDLAVILLKKPLKFDSKVGKIDMVDRKYVIDTDDHVVMIGHSADELRYLNSSITNFSGCQRSYRDNNNNHPWLHEKRQFCVYHGTKNINTGFAGGMYFYCSYFRLNEN